MKLYNSLSKKIEELTPLRADQVRMYSCGPTVYDHAHIGNLSAFIFADTLRRVIAAQHPRTRHVMNLTDVDDKTIAKSRAEYPELKPKEALAKTTEQYASLFYDDMKAIGNDIDAIHFVRATDTQTMQDIQALITKLHHEGFAYIADDGVYFSIEAYKASGKKYGQLVDLSEASTSEARIQNDEYDKESLHDFALWKRAKADEPAWEFELDGQSISGRPGWHIECSVMSVRALEQPFDIHTGGIDLAFPHHENEIAQSTAGNDDPTYARFFVHNDHILVDGRKMSKSLQNFYTLEDLLQKQIDPLAFRLLVLQSQYRRPTNFSFENVDAATSRLKNWRAIAALRHQTHDGIHDDNDHATDDKSVSLLATRQAVHEALFDDLDTPRALAIIDEAFGRLERAPITCIHRGGLLQLLETIDDLLGLQLCASTPDISDDAKQQIIARERVRETKDWDASDALREDILREYSIVLRDTPYGTIWEYQ